jgi:hypothetical protein
MNIEHTKYRCNWISIMIGLSLYGWYNYSLFDPINNDFFTSYYLNCVSMVIYLGWDIYYILSIPVLFRMDLIIHHFLAIGTFLLFMNICPLQMNNTVIMESISLMNYYWRNNPNLLKIYRMFCILFIRFPIWYWVWIYYFPNYVLPHYKDIISHNHYTILSVSMRMILFCGLYDVFIIYKILKNKKKSIILLID